MNKTAWGILCFAWLCVSAPYAYAQCVAGVPCITTDYTVGDGTNAAKSDSPACDAEFMNQIYARAFLEAQRENIMAQTYIRKPDSVMEYSCLDRLIGQVRPHAVNLFSSSTVWQNRTVPLNIAYTAAGNQTSVTMTSYMGANSIVTPLNNVVGETLGNYVNTNFDHDYLGGTAGIGSSISTSIPGGAYNCSVMRTVWDLAKCQNFDSAANTFMTFDELVSTDPRQFPTLGACVTDITAELITTSRNAGPTYDTALFDPIDPYLDLLLPAASDADCQDPVETGLEVVVRDYTFGSPSTANPSGITVESAAIPEGICINPGCYYHVDVDFAPTPTPTPGPGSPPIPLFVCPDGTTVPSASDPCPIYTPPGECRDG
ncbi:MAG: hypothetical protein ACLFR0_06985 [Alphaproteobacteria bacterium]